MSSYQIPIKHNNEFSTIFNNMDYDVLLSYKSNSHPIQRCKIS